MQTTHIELFGLTVTEPFTWITNWMMAAASFYFGHMLFHSKSADRPTKFWSMFFLFIGLASLTGGTAHGFINYVGNNFHLAAWIFTGIGVYGAERASLELIKDKNIYKFLLVLTLLELVTMIGTVLVFKSFESVRTNTLIGLLGIVLPIQLYNYFKQGFRSGFILAIGIASNLIPAFIHAIRYSYNRWFNFNDISHLVMIFCFYIMYRGAKVIAIEPRSAKKQLT